MIKANLLNPHLEGDSFFWKAGPTGVLLIHGFTATTSEVRPLAKTLYEHGYTVAAPLLPGHGTSVQELGRCRWRDWSDAVEATYRDLVATCSHVFVGGESMGGLLALYLAEHHPELAGVMSYAAALAYAPPSRRWLPRLLAPFVPIVDKGIEPPDVGDRLWQGYDQRSLPAVNQMTVLQQEVRRHLGQITIPLLIVQGKRDDTVSPSAAQWLYDRVASRDKELHWFDDAPHVILLSAARRAVEELTLHFIRRIERTW